MIINRWISLLGASILTIGLTACTNSPEEADSLNNSQTAPQGKTATDSSTQTSKESKGIANKYNQDPTLYALVNKELSLDKTYEPDDLVKVDVPTVLENPEINQLRQVAAAALKEMFAEAKKADIYLHARSGYRSYQTQAQLFQNYSAKHGEEAANRYSAKAGQSEHQTGLAMDVTSESVNLELVESFGETKEGKWLREHAHEYGFIIRYPKGKEQITGYMYEPWHIRYIGVQLATDVYKSELTYEEYLSE